MLVVYKNYRELHLKHKVHTQHSQIEMKTVSFC